MALSWFLSTRSWARITPHGCSECWLCVHEFVREVRDKRGKREDEESNADGPGSSLSASKSSRGKESACLRFEKF